MIKPKPESEDYFSLFFFWAQAFEEALFFLLFCDGNIPVDLRFGPEDCRLSFFFFGTVHFARKGPGFGVRSLALSLSLFWYFCGQFYAFREQIPIF